MELSVGPAGSRWWAVTYMRENFALSLYWQIGDAEKRAGRGSRSLVAASGHGDW